MNASTESVVPPSIEERISSFNNPDPVETPQETPVEAPQETVEALETATPTEAPAETETEPTQAEPQAEFDGIELESLQDLAGHLDVEVGDLYNLKIPVTNAAGEREEVSLGDWKDGFQSSNKFKAQQAELDTQRNTLEAERQKMKDEIGIKSQQATKLVEMAEAQLVQDFQKVDWQDLRVNDPGEFSALQAEFNMRQSQIQQAKNDVGQQQQQMTEEQQQAQKAEMQELLRQEENLLLAKVPEWTDPDKRASERDGLSKYLVGEGFAQEDVAQCADHRVVVMARKAMLYDQMQTKADVTKKKVIRVGKNTLKPGSKQGRADTAANNKTDAMAQVRKTGNWRDAALAIRSIEK